jgi:hypothetical protein
VNSIEYASTDITQYSNLVVNLPPQPIYSRPSTGPRAKSSSTGGPPTPPPHPQPHDLCLAMGASPDLNIQVSYNYKEETNFFSYFYSFDLVLFPLNEFSESIILITYNVNSVILNQFINFFKKRNKKWINTLINVIGGW